MIQCGALIVLLFALFSLSVHAQGHWTPTRGAGEARLSRSPLQLPPGTLLLVDETGLREGTLDEKGTASLATLAKVLAEQV